MVECIWSPNLTIFEKKVNKKNIFYKKCDCYERAMTFDGDPIYCDSEYINGNFITLFKNILFQI